MLIIISIYRYGERKDERKLIDDGMVYFQEIHSTIEDTYVASVDTGKGSRDTLRIYDTAGLQGSVQLPRHYLAYPDAFVLVYDPSDPSSLDMLGGIKGDIDKFKDKKEVSQAFLVVQSRVDDSYMCFCLCHCRFSSL